MIQSSVGLMELMRLGRTATNPMLVLCDMMKKAMPRNRRSEFRRFALTLL